jgi:hypothetical protein
MLHCEVIKIITIYHSISSKIISFTQTFLYKHFEDSNFMMQASAITHKYSFKITSHNMARSIVHFDATKILED